MYQIEYAKWDGAACYSAGGVYDTMSGPGIYLESIFFHSWYLKLKVIITDHPDGEVLWNLTHYTKLNR